MADLDAASAAASTWVSQAFGLEPDVRSSWLTVAAHAPYMKMAETLATKE